jgi:hypothetical protein
LDGQDGPNVTTRILIRERGRQETQRRGCEDGSRGWGDLIAGYEEKSGTGAWTWEKPRKDA